MAEARAYARIQVLVEVVAPGTYDLTWKLEDLVEQAQREALNKLGRVLSNEKGHVGEIIGEPKVEVFFRMGT